MKDVRRIADPVKEFRTPAAFLALEMKAIAALDDSHLLIPNRVGRTAKALFLTTTGRPVPYFMLMQSFARVARANTQHPAILSGVGNTEAIPKRGSGPYSQNRRTMICEANVIVDSCFAHWMRSATP
jgi:hypothetical protein